MGTILETVTHPESDVRQKALGEIPRLVEAHQRGELTRELFTTVLNQVSLDLREGVKNEIEDALGCTLDNLPQQKSPWDRTYSGKTSL